MTNDVLQKVKIPAIGLIITGALNGLTGILTLLSGLFRLVAGRENPVPSDDAERMGYYFGTAFGYGIALLSILAAPVILYGAIQMLGGKKYGLARISAVLAILPLTSCCFLAGIPIGIWALIVLSKPDVKAFFKGEMPSQNMFTPQPPQNW